MRWGPVIGASALLVTAPRLTLAYLEADGAIVPEGLRNLLLVVTALATGVVVTGGGIYLAYRAARTVGQARSWLLCAWGALLLASGWLISPLVVLQLARSPLAAVLSSGWSRWLWAWAGVLVVEIVAGAAVALEGPQAAGPERVVEEKGKACEYCGKPCKNPQARAGHLRSCPNRPRI